MPGFLVAGTATAREPRRVRDVRIFLQVGLAGRGQGRESRGSRCAGLAGAGRMSWPAVTVPGLLSRKKFCRCSGAIRLALIAKPKHGIAVFTAIRDALTGNPRVPPIPASA